LNMASVEQWIGSQIAKTADSAPEVAEIWGEIETLYKTRLWHQLTVKLLGFIGHETLADGLIELHTNLIKDLADRMSPMSLTKILLAVAQQIPDAQEAITFLEGDDGVVQVKATPLAVAALKTEVARLKMDLDDVPTAQKLLEECEELLDRQAGVTPTHIDYYRVSAQLRMLQSDFEGFYTEALRFLGCVNLEDLDDAEKAARAFDLGLAALCGESIFNVGELLAHPILDALRDTPKSWLVDLLYAYNSGNVQKFEDTKPLWSSKSEDLADKEDMLRGKFELTAVMEAVFVRGTSDRSISFADLASAISVPVDKVEVIVMKALSKGLVKGTINQIDSVVQFSWVQPRVLDMEQLGKMRDRLGEWLASVKKGSQLMRDGAPELMVAP